jgi:hypothetical protein
MKGLSSLERITLECVGKKNLSFAEIENQTGLHHNVCFNVLQALVIRGLLRTNGIFYSAQEDLSPLLTEDINGLGARYAETMEMIEAVLEQKEERVFRFQKIALDARDEKIFLAMLSNLESFLLDAHKKAHTTTPLKDRKVIFWGVGEVKKLMKQMMAGK